ncbi:MAG: tail fiber domain-containing protein [Chitinophagales bacterium]
MKTQKIILNFLIIILSLPMAMAQVPDAMNYQGVLRDGNGDIQANETVDVRFTVLSSGTAEFDETHSGVTTNAFGMINLQIGTQNPGDFSAIDWSTGSKELQVEVDALDGDGFKNLGTSELLSVPYALRAGTAPAMSMELNDLDDVDASGASNGDFLQFDGTDWVPAAGAGGGSNWSTSGSDIYYDSGNVGIGTSAPNAPLHILATGTGLNDGIRMTSSQGTNEDWYLYMSSSENLTIRDDGTDVFTIENGTGNVGIGTSSPAGRLDVNGWAILDSVEFADGPTLFRKGTGSYSLAVGADIVEESGVNNFDIGNNNMDDRWDEVVATDFVTFSDKNVKKNINALNYGLNDIMQLNPVSYIYKDSPGDEVKNGLIAQEVLKVYPEAVNQYDWDYNQETGKVEKQDVEVLGISYGEFVPLLIKGMQEQQATIQDLESELNAMKAEIQNLKNK